ncbi:MAG: sigma-70 family RNA polymerase sigma factor [Gemmatales bacterium]|nr:sigma-70 family RNA polymerase sigma factor [Gemmatales bacterium]
MMADLRWDESTACDQSGAGPTDAELITRWRRGDHAALEALLVRYEKPIYLFVLGILRDPHRAEDALQETFYTALTRLDGVDASHFRGWLFTVAYHQAMLEKRREALARRWVSLDNDSEQLPLSAKTPEPWQELAQREQRQQVYRWLRHLPPHQQEVVRLRFLEGLRFRDIAARLGVPLGTALARLHQALKRLLRLAGENHDHSS